MRTSHVCFALLLCLFLTPSVLQAQVPGGLTPLEVAEPTGALANRVTVNVTRAPLETVLRLIANDGHVRIVFSTDMAAAQGPRTLHLDRVPARTAILAALDGTSLAAFVTPDNSVVVRPRTERPATKGTNGTISTERVPEAPTPQGQVVRGRVLDRASRMPLPGANVVVMGTDPLMGATTDNDGHYAIPGVPLGRHDLMVSYVGFEALVIPGVVVTSAKEVVQDVLLTEQVFTGAEVVIEAENRKDLPMNDMALVGARSLSVEEMRRYAGGLDDPARLASSYAGVASGVGVQDNGIVVRGNAPKSLTWRLEGVEIPNPSHFAGMQRVGAGGVTLFSAQVMANSDFFTSAFPAEYGNALGGVFDMNFRSGNTSRREHAVQLGLLGVDLASEGPFRKGADASYLFNYRYSTLGLLMPILPTEDVATFQDLSFKLAFPTRRMGRFEWWGIGGLDGQTMGIEQDSSKWEYDTWDRLALDLKLGVGATGFGWTLPLGSRTFLRTNLAVTANLTRMDQQRIGDDLRVEDNVYLNSLDGRFVAGTLINHKFSSRHTNRTGITAQRLFYDLALDVAIDDSPPAVPVASGKGSNLFVQAYTSSRFDLTSRLAVNAGVHTSHFALTGKSAIEPRLAVQYAPDAVQTFSAGYGLHSQLEPLRFYLIEVAGSQPNRTLDFARAHHAALGYDRRLGSNARMKLEGYYQRLFRVPVVQDSSFSMLNFENDWAFNAPLVSTGAGENYGVELTLERFLRDGYYFLITGSVFESTYRGGDGVWRPTRYDRNAMANFLVGKEWQLGPSGNLAGVNLRGVYNGGMRRSPLHLAASLEREEVVYDERRAFEDRDAGIFVMDLTLNWRRNHRRVSEVWALQVKNVLMAKDVSYDYNFKTDEVETVEEGYPLPVLSYKLEF